VILRDNLDLSTPSSQLTFVAIAAMAENRVNSLFTMH
jgi:hypothetical protein